MRPVPFAAISSLMALAVGACAAPPGREAAPGAQAGSAPRQCFWTRNVNGFAAADDNVVNVRVSGGDIYQLALFAPCRDVDWAQGVALRSRAGSTVCTGADAELIVPGPLGPNTCQVREVRRLTPEEAAALPSRARP
ncbi:DUF6491 family protein [Phenylobacterium deserti]|uniref:Lipoprotein n=1 Tax=Phenylobacterium deserti TaxID=1914756 RepID=A0A328ADB7_9CAUL|nr:DUF6491 family protein [Phenylobacterium deserti]RAK52585.1 hypothetical protein DJ018_10265 [Phenylobacterium deserti]